MWIKYNPNPNGKQVGDCTVRAISKATGQDWYKTYCGLCLCGFELCDMPSANSVWGAYLKSKGFYRHVIPNTCPNCYTVNDFCNEHKTGVYLLAIGTHVVCCINGNFYDTWDSSNESPVYYFKKDEE